MKRHWLLTLWFAGSVMLAGQVRDVGPKKEKPEIPDEVAFVHFLGVLAHSNPLEGQEALAIRREAFCSHIGLNAEQGEILIDIAEKYHRYMNGLKSEAERRVGPATLAVNGNLTSRQRAILKAIAKGRQGMIRSLAHQLYARLDDQGDRLVEEFINTKIKPRVVM